jgi:hypothetical protein
MVLGCNYSSQNRLQLQMNVPPSQAISMAMAVRRCNTERIAQCSMTRASPEATGRRHWATTRSVSPRRPPGRQSTQREWNMYHFAGRFNGHHNVVVLYNAHHPMEEVRGFHKSH